MYYTPTRFLLHSISPNSIQITLAFPQQRAGNSPSYKKHLHPHLKNQIDLLERIQSSNSSLILISNITEKETWYNTNCDRCSHMLIYIVQKNKQSIDKQKKRIKQFTYSLVLNDVTSYHIDGIMMLLTLHHQKAMIRCWTTFYIYQGLPKRMYRKR
jgi:hypothetical protein